MLKVKANTIIQQSPTQHLHYETQPSSDAPPYERPCSLHAAKRFAVLPPHVLTAYKLVKVQLCAAKKAQDTQEYR